MKFFSILLLVGGIFGSQALNGMNQPTPMREAGIWNLATGEKAETPHERAIRLHPEEETRRQAERAQRKERERQLQQRYGAPRSPVKARRGPLPYGAQAGQETAQGRATQAGELQRHYGPGLLERREKVNLP